MFDGIFGDCALIFAGFMEEMCFGKGSLADISESFVHYRKLLWFFLTDSYVQHLTSTWKKGPAQVMFKASLCIQIMNI